MAEAVLWYLACALNNREDEHFRIVAALWNPAFFFTQMAGGRMTCISMKQQFY